MCMIVWSLAMADIVVDAESVCYELYISAQ